MTAPHPDTPAVEIDGQTVRIRDLAVIGPAADAVIAASADGGDPADVVRRMLDIGGIVLQHGSASNLADTVISAIRQETANIATVRRMQDQIASKGLRYEEQIRPVLERVFGTFHDTVEDTSTITGVDGRSKQGDFVAHLNKDTTGGRDRRVVIEAKDRPSQRLTGKDGALTYLSESMANRDAEAGVFVCATDMPALGGQRLRVHSGNRIMVLFDKNDGDPLALEVACQLARFLADRTIGEETSGIDRELLTVKVARLAEIIDAAKEIRGGVQEVRRGIARIDIAYDRLRDDALAVLAEMEDRLAT